jgi:hypothetical protein
LVLRLLAAAAAKALARRKASEEGWQGEPVLLQGDYLQSLQGL